ncbi:hypothetical protein B4107_1655 [Bacillus safensis]|nr:hypothetical protein B4107_1655 [Bacillus safensis]
MNPLTLLISNKELYGKLAEKFHCMQNSPSALTKNVAGSGRFIRRGMGLF